jgi:hypothetical protein
LAVLNNEGLTSADTVVVQVASPPPITPPILVNIFGGTNPFNNAAWNNWNCISSAGNSGALKRSDGTTTTISARLSQSDGIGDNGTNYTGSLAPAEVLRYTSHAGGPSRTLTISGLNPALSYDFQFFGSRLRTDDQRTTYTIGTTSVTIATDNNRTNAASFFGIKPNASGVVVVTLSRPSNRTFTYLNGFTINNSGQAANKINTAPLVVSANQALELAAPTMGEIEAKAYPNPSRQHITLAVAGNYRGTLDLIFVDATGQNKMKVSALKQTDKMNIPISIQSLQQGIYHVRIVTPQTQTTIKVWKQ